MKKQEEIKTLVINNDKYVRESDIKNTEPDECNGLKYGVIRSRNQGVMSGYIKEIDVQQVTVLKARQLWRWNTKFTLVEMAEYGINNVDDCKFSCEASQEVVMLEACAVLYCTKKAGESIRGVEAQEND